MEIYEFRIDERVNQLAIQIRRSVESYIRQYQGEFVERPPKDNRFEFVVLAGKRARQLLKGALPREAGDKKIAIAQKEILRRKVVKIDEPQ
jgi:DNA-directed RNA polymerase subunit K/omega